MNVTIYQIKVAAMEKCECKYVFRGWDYAKENGFNMGDYEDVYSYFIEKDHPVATEDEKMGILEDIFMDFQAGCAEFPEGFEGHSISVSDVVMLDDEIYYCDNFGWVRIK